VLPKQPHVPDEVTAGLPTVGIRMPAHPVALAMISFAGVPVAAPSANRFTELSPTTAEHVRRNLGDAVDMVLDCGSTPVGIESTVVSLAANPPALLRPGMVTREEIEAVTGPLIVIDRAGDAHPSPGLHPRHYSPRTKLLIVEGDRPAAGSGVYVSHRRNADVRMPREARAYAAALYATLHRLDEMGYDWIAVERPPFGPEWAGIHDRLSRAAAQ